ncbi:Uncharacterised protein [Rothia kristinae]|nr:Uncharacterised protein [Rothia kristinae]
MRVIGQLFTILDVPAGPPRAAEGDAETPAAGRARTARILRLCRWRCAFPGDGR